MFVIHEPYTAKIPHLYSGCQAFQRLFSRAKANILSVFACAAVRLRVSSHAAFSVINVISFQLFLNAVACLENIGDKFLLLYYNMNNIIIKFSLCIKVWRVFKLKTDDIDDGVSFSGGMTFSYVEFE